MKYAKYILGFALFLFAYSSAIGIAADSRYESIMAGDTIIAQFDKKTVRYEKDPYFDKQLLSVWIKSFSTSNKEIYSLNHYLFRLHDREMLLLDTIEYNENGQIINKMTNTYNPILWTQILPETVSETWYFSILKYSQDNKVQLQEDYKERIKK